MSSNSLNIKYPSIGICLDKKTAQTIHDGKINSFISTTRTKLPSEPIMLCDSEMAYGIITLTSGPVRIYKKQLDSVETSSIYLDSPRSRRKLWRMDFSFQRFGIPKNAIITRNDNMLTCKVRLTPGTNQIIDAHEIDVSGIEQTCSFPMDVHIISFS